MLAYILVRRSFYCVEVNSFLSVASKQSLARCLLPAARSVLFTDWYRAGCTLWASEMVLCCKTKLNILCQVVGMSLTFVGDILFFFA